MGSLRSVTRTLADHIAQLFPFIDIIKWTYNVQRGNMHLLKQLQLTRQQGSSSGVLKGEWGVRNGREVRTGKENPTSSDGGWRNSETELLEYKYLGNCWTTRHKQLTSSRWDKGSPWRPSVFCLPFITSARHRSASLFPCHPYMSIDREINSQTSCSSRSGLSWFQAGVF